MNCRETRPLLPLFFDGELEARQMRAVALHSTRCAECEDELKHFERLQDAVSAHISSLVDEVDLNQIWAGVAPRIAAPAPSWSHRVRAWWDELEIGWLVRGPAFAAVAAGLLLTLTFWPRPEPASGPSVASRDERVDNSVVVDSMQSSGDSVALMTDEETNTTLLWIMDEGGSPAAEHAEWDVPE